jgi:hypothetical protein
MFTLTIRMPAEKDERLKALARSKSIRVNRLMDVDDRGRDAGYPAPPAQIRTCPIRAYGSYLGCLTARRSSGQG